MCSGVFNGMLQFIWFSIISLKVCHLVVSLHSVSGLLYWYWFVLVCFCIQLLLVYDRRLRLRLRLSSSLGVIFSLFVFSSLVTAKIRRSGFLFRSVGQYVGVPVDNILRLLFLMYFSSGLPRGVVFLDPHSVCFEL